MRKETEFEEKMKQMVETVTEETMRKVEETIMEHERNKTEMSIEIRTEGHPELRLWNASKTLLIKFGSIEETIVAIDLPIDVAKLMAVKIHDLLARPLQTDMVEPNCEGEVNSDEDSRPA